VTGQVTAKVGQGKQVRVFNSYNN